jgi:hypothetical protein
MKQNCNTYEVFFSQPNPSVAISSQASDCHLLRLSQFFTATASYLVAKSKFKVTLRLTVGQSVSLGVEAHVGLMARYLLLFDNYGLVLLWGAFFDERRGMYMLLALASAVFLGSESLGTRGHIFLSQF